MSVSDKSLQLIKQDKISQKPRWQFILKDAITWLGLIGALVLSALVLGVSIFVLNESDLDVRIRVGQSFIGNIFEAIPFLLIFLFIMAVIVAYFNFRRTKTGYRYSGLLVIIVSLILSLSLGGTIYVSGLSKECDRIFSEHVPNYTNLVKPNQDEVWNHPELGLLAGQVIKVDPRQKLLLIDFTDETWIVNIADVPQTTRTLAKEGKVVKLLGKQIDNDTFNANEIRIWSNRRIRNIVVDNVEKYLK